MVWKQGPCVAESSGLFKNRSQPVEKILTVPVIPEDMTPFDAIGHDVVEKTEAINSGKEGHGISFRPWSRGRRSLRSLGLLGLLRPVGPGMF